MLSKNDTAFKATKEQSVYPAALQLRGERRQRTAAVLWVIFAIGVGVGPTGRAGSNGAGVRDGFGHRGAAAIYAAPVLSKGGGRM